MAAEKLRSVAPIGIFGLVNFLSTLATTGFPICGAMRTCWSSVIGCMLLVALVVNPLLVFFSENSSQPHSLVLASLARSGVFCAFFYLRSSCRQYSSEYGAVRN
ncbi:hypothetical protein KCP77_05345 [Salmonella enterica subsp. enterica]|nr:hypothetical protein KCP77_05345 [Salmonella enterica subsp. enterica]